MKDIISMLPKGLNGQSILTIIIPFRYNEERRSILERISFSKLDRSIPKNVNFLLVDDGSEEKYTREIQNRCSENGISYMRLNTSNRMFSAARARNYGAMYSLSSYILFMDVDLCVYDGFYNDVLDEIKLNDLEDNVRDFIGFGVIYLTYKGSKKFFASDERLRKKQFIQYLLENNEEYIEKFSTGTSVQVFNREYYLARGGNYEVFEGWGFEDLEFTCRLAHKSKKFPMPQNFLQDYKNCRDIVEYKGFKSLIRLYGDITFAKGISLFHIWHEVDAESGYMQQKQKNRALFEKLLKDYIEKGIEPDPLPDMTKGNTLLFTQTHPAIFNREVLPRYGEIFYEEEDKFTNINSLAKYIKRFNIKRVILQNPYSNSIRKKIYDYLRDNDIEYYISERGALPESMFFDNQGLNADSQSYHPMNWDIEISEENRTKAVEYINAELNNTTTLEIQPDRTEPRKLVRQLKINPGKKVLFVPFQTYADTVITYFCGPFVKTYEEFVELVQETTNKLSDEWVVIYKKHPLSKLNWDIEGAICADNYNIKDLLNISDCVLLINSGVGVLSMLWNKPVLYTGEIFYSHDEINRRVKNVDEVIHNLNNLFVPSKEKIIRFISYLINDFYSFGKFNTKLVDWTKESNMTITTGIDFYKVNNLGNTKYIYDPNRSVKINNKSILFDRYKYYFETASKVNYIPANQIRRFEPKNNQERILLIRRRWNKLINNPHRYFSDSRFKPLRVLKHFFK